MTPDRPLQSEIEQLEQRFAENPQGRVFAHLADLYRQARRLEEAEALVVEGLKRHPNYVSAYLVLGRVYADWGRHDQAGAQFARVLELDAQNLVALRALGDLAAERGLWEEARSWYERVLQIDPYNEEAKSAIGKLPTAAAEPAEAPEGAGKPADAESEAVSGYSRYGEELLDAGTERPGEPAAPEAARSGAASDAGEPSTEAAPAPATAEEPEGEVTPVTETMAELYAEQGLLEDAIEIYRELQARRPEEPRFARRIEELRAKVQEQSAPPPLPTGPDEPLPRERDVPEKPGAPPDSPTPVLELEAESREAGPSAARKPESEPSGREPAAASTDWMEAAFGERPPEPAAESSAEEVELPDWLADDSEPAAASAAPGAADPWEAAPASPPSASEPEPWAPVPASEPMGSREEDVPLPGWLTDPTERKGRPAPAPGAAPARAPESRQFAFRATAGAEELGTRDPFAASFEAAPTPQPPIAPPGPAPASGLAAARTPARPEAEIEGSAGTIAEYIAGILSHGETAPPAERPAPPERPTATPPTAPAASRPSPEATQPAPPGVGHPQAGESEDDLSQFQSWLRSLKR